MLSAPGRTPGATLGRRARGGLSRQEAGEARNRNEREAVRSRLTLALGRCPEQQRLMLALLLVERLSPAEASSVLGVPVRRLASTYRETLAGLRQAALGRAPVAPRARRIGAEPRLRKAS